MALYSFEKSKARIAYASQYLPGGVNSNYRLRISPTPLVVERADGPYIIDADGNQLIDYYLGMGPVILGHSSPSVTNALIEQLKSGLLFAAQTEVEIAAAGLMCELVPCAERVRFMSSGSEANQAAIRLARAATGRQTVVKFEGHFHGWLDNLQWSVAPSLEQCGPAENPHKVPGTIGQDPRTGESIAVLGWNDLSAVEKRLARGDIAAVIMEPAMCNMGAIAPQPGYLEGVRAACSKAGTVLIFDEVITGFRLAIGGAQQLFGLVPDLATFGKALANGFPVAALAGRADLMDQFANRGVLHAGTYNGNPLAMAATIATLRELAEGHVHATIERLGKQLMQGLTEVLKHSGCPARVQGFPGIFHVSFGVDSAIKSYRDLYGIDRERYVRFTTALLLRGVRALERGAWFLSAAHDERVIEQTIRAANEAMSSLG